MSGVSLGIIFLLITKGGALFERIQIKNIKMP